MSNFLGIYICFSLVDELIEDVSNSSVELRVFKSVSEYIPQKEPNYITPVIIIETLQVIDEKTLRVIDEPQIVPQKYSYYQKNKESALEYQRIYREIKKKEKNKLIIKRSSIQEPVLTTDEPQIELTGDDLKRYKRQQTNRLYNEKRRLLKKENINCKLV